VDADIAGFFDNLPFPIIMTAVAEKVADGNILRLIEKFLRSGVMEGGVFKPTTVGTPQGGVLSPLLANIVLNHMDWQLDKLGWHFVRYADDFVIVCQTPAKAEEALADVRQILQGLGLTLSAQKTKITTYRKGYSFLGFWLSARSRRMRPKSLLKFKDKIREVTCRKLNFEAKVIVKLNQVIRGTAQYFATPFFTARETFHKLDSWIRMRLRSMKYKRRCLEDNRKMRVKTFERLGVLTLESFCWSPTCQTMLAGSSHQAISVRKVRHWLDPEA
jgi:group II intron reverse transcriptase/maturase